MKYREEFFSQKKINHAKFLQSPVKRWQHLSYLVTYVPIAFEFAIKYSIWDILGIDSRESKSIGMGVAAQSETNVGCMCWNFSEGWGSLAFFDSQQNTWSTENTWTSVFITFRVNIW